jgi:pyridoxal phosphate enzyme (YggS family)
LADIATNIRLLKTRIPESVKIVAVSKSKPVSDIMEAYNAGHRIFGENRVQELLRKKEMLPSDIEWHLIGHLQSNKVKQVVPLVSMIESVDSYRLLETINRESEKAGRITDCLIQFHIASEETKSGFDIDDALQMFSSGGLRNLAGVRLMGVMGIATFTDDMTVVRKEFRTLKSWFDRIRENYFRYSDSFCEISMGMSGDYSVAIEEGATIVRIGSLIFGKRT